MRRIIGAQVRVGGKRKFFTDKQFLTMEELDLFYSRIDTYIRANNLSLDSVYIFVSTDEPKVFDHFKQRYNASMYFIDDFSIGHSSLNKNHMRRDIADEYAKRAIVDLLLLQRADYLIYTNTSSFGFLASQLQQNRISTVRTDKYIDWQSQEECIVFERSSRPVLSEVVGDIVLY